NREPLERHQNRSQNDRSTQQEKRALLSGGRPNSRQQQKNGDKGRVTNTHIRREDLRKVSHACWRSIGSPLPVNLRDIRQQAPVSHADYYRRASQWNPKSPGLPDKLSAARPASGNGFDREQQHEKHDCINAVEV